MTRSKDFLDEIIDERTRRTPEFPEMVDAALRSRQLLRELAARRQALGLSQTTVAARMGTSQSALARLEGGETDPRISTVERYALAIGQDLALRRLQTDRPNEIRSAGATPLLRSREGRDPGSRSSAS